MVIISSTIAGRIAYALAKDMVNFEAAKRLAPNLIDSSRRWISETIQQHRGYQQVVENDEEERKTARSIVSTEYLVHNWLEALFAWFQVVILWHEPYLSLCTISGLLTSFLFLTYFAPRFYASVLIAIFVFNLYKFWFGHVWPEIRVPPGEDRENELRLDVDRFTYLHPQLMTLAELQRHVESFIKLAKNHLHELLELRQRKPIVFCSKLCFVFVCTGIIGNTLSGLSLVFIALVVLMTAPGVYVHLMSDDTKHWLHRAVGQKFFSKQKSESHQDQSRSQLEGAEENEHTQPDSTSEISSNISRERILKLFESLVQGGRSAVGADSRIFTSPATTSSDEGEADCTDRTQLIDIPLSTAKGRSISRKGSDDVSTKAESRNRRASSYSKDEDEEAQALLESDDDQQDGFVML